MTHTTPLSLATRTSTDEGLPMRFCVVTNTPSRIASYSVLACDLVVSGGDDLGPPRGTNNKQRHGGRRGGQDSILGWWERAV